MYTKNISHYKNIFDFVTGFFSG